MRGTMKHTKFCRTQAGTHYFNFVCVGCKAEGKLGIPKAHAY